MITITHTHAEGTLLTGSHPGDGVWEIARRHGFTYRRSVGIFVRGSRDRVANRYKINGLAEALRAAGHEVTVNIDDTHRDRATVLADQADRLDERRDALTAKAARRADEAQTARNRSDALVANRPPGQPVLVDHHSGAADQRRLDKSVDLAIKAATVLQPAADQAARRAAAVGSAAAYSATPAVTARRIERLETELRDIDRKLAGYTDKWGGEHTPAAGGWREQLEARRAQLVDELAYDRAALAAAIDEGRYTAYGPHNVKAGYLVRVNGFWRKVVKVNRVTVSVETGYSWTDKIRYTDLREILPAPESRV